MTTNKKEMTRQETIKKQVMSLHNVESFNCKVFTNENGEVVESFAAFYLNYLETESRKAILKDIENGFLAESNDLLKEVNCSINILSELFADISEVQKRRIACVMPFIGGKASVVTNEYFGFTKDTKKKMKVLTAKFIQRVSEYMKLENLMTKTDAPLQELQAKKRDCYMSARTILQNFYDVVIGEKYCKASNADCKEVIHALQTITLEKDAKRLVSTPETVGKTMALLLKVCGNTLNGKTIATRYESKNAESIIKAEQTAAEKAAAKAAAKEAAQKEELKAERKKAETTK